MWDQEKKALGARLLDVSWTSSTIELETDRGTLTGRAYGGCCSRSWFESVEVDAVGGTLTEFEDDRFDHSEDSDYEVMKVYFGTIKTTKGRVTYELRNASNGYYGGSVKWTWVPA